MLTKHYKNVKYVWRKYLSHIQKMYIKINCAQNTFLYLFKKYQVSEKMLTSV